MVERIRSSFVGGVEDLSEKRAIVQRRIKVVVEEELE